MCGWFIAAESNTNKLGDWCSLAETQQCCDLVITTSRFTYHLSHAKCAKQSLVLFRAPTSCLRKGRTCNNLPSRRQRRRKSLCQPPMPTNPSDPIPPHDVYYHYYYYVISLSNFSKKKYYVLFFFPSSLPSSFLSFSLAPSALISLLYVTTYSGH